MIDMARERLVRWDFMPYYLYRQKNIAGNFENVGYAKVDKAGIYNILIMEEKQSIMLWVQAHRLRWCFQCLFLCPAVRTDGPRHLIRMENVKDVGEYISRIDEMIERKGEWLWH